ncbi:MAG: ABC transporter substrate-binding protein [Micropepsaceae bacterium]
MSNLQLTVAMPDYDHTRDLALGRVVPEGIDLTCLILPVEEIFYRFLIHREWDASEISLAKYCSMRASGDDSLIGLPIFPARIFRQSSLFVRRDGPIKEMGDVKGKRIGLPEWAQSAAVYSRGFLVEQYGVDLTTIEWVQAGTNEPGRKEKAKLNLPDGIKLTRIMERSLNEMLLSGEIDGMFSARPPSAYSSGDSNVRRLYENFIDIESEYFSRTGIFPIMHAFAVRKEILEKNPWVARNLFNAFNEAKNRSIARAMDGTVPMFPIPWCFEHARAGKELLGEDYFPYGVEPNRKTLEAFLRWAFEQGVCSRHLKVEDIFPPQMFGEHRV